MASILLEATNNIHTMYEIESILNNDDIPAHSRDLFLQFMTESINGKLSPKQQKNVDIFRKLYVRVDKDMRFFRNFLDLAVSMAEHFKFEQTPLVYAFKNISLEDHFLNFLDFASRQNLIIEKNNPLQLFISLGCSIIKLALQKNQIEHVRKINEDKRKELFSKYSELKRGISRRFIDMDFGTDFSLNSEPHTNDLDNFNCDDDFDDEDNHRNTSVIMDVNEVDKCVDILKTFNDQSTLSTDNTIIKTLENGNKEVNIENLDSLVMEAGLKFGPSVIQQITKAEIHHIPSNFTSIQQDSDDDDFFTETKLDTINNDNDSGILKDLTHNEDTIMYEVENDDAILKNKPILHYNNHTIHNMVNFIDNNKAN